MASDRDSGSDAGGGLVGAENGYMSDAARQVTCGGGCLPCSDRQRHPWGRFCGSARKRRGLLDWNRRRNWNCNWGCERDLLNSV